MGEVIPEVLSKVDDKNQVKSKKIDTSVGYNCIKRKYFPILAQLEDVQLYRIHKSEIFSAAQKLVLKTALTEEKMRKASFISLLQGFEILNKAERLENGLSTSNLSVRFGKTSIDGGTEK